VTRRIARRGVQPKEFSIASPVDVEAHISALRDLGKAANRGMCMLMELELRIRSSVNELEIALQQAACTELHSVREWLTPGEAARKLGVPLPVLRSDRNGRFPRPVRKTGTRPKYRRAEIDAWLLGQFQEGDLVVRPNASPAEPSNRSPKPSSVRESIRKSL
jgi:hypothetical protein